MHRKEFDKVIEDHKRQVINVAYRFLNNYSDAEDIAQEVFLRVYKALPRYKPQAKFDGTFESIPLRLPNPEIPQAAWPAIQTADQHQAPAVFYAHGFPAPCGDL